MTRQPLDVLRERWFDSLPAHQRDAVRALFDERLDDLSLTRTAATGAEQQGAGFTRLPIVLAGTMVEPDDEGAPGSWFQDFYDYAADKKYIFIEDKRFHICTQARSARHAIRRGLIPADFECSAANRSCPMRRILRSRPGCAVRLRLIPACSLAPRSRPQGAVRLER
jgi:hypothetical protein